MKTKKSLAVFGVIIIVFLIVVVGLYLLDQKDDEKEIEETLPPLVDPFYPKPPEILMSLNGTIKGIRGGLIGLEVMDPDDYLPHPDGSPQRKEIRFVSLFSNTEIVLIDYTNPQPDGSPTVTPLKLSDLRRGDEVRVESKKNIRDAKEFDAQKIEVVRY